MTRRAAFLAYVLAGLLSFSPAHAAGTADKAYEPISGQAGKDVVWVPTPPALIDGAAMQGKRHDGKPGDFRARRIGG